MKKLIMIIAGLCIGIFVLGGVFTLLGVVFSFTFGVLGGIIRWLFRVLLTPAVLILVIIFLAYKLKKKSA